MARKTSSSRVGAPAPYRGTPSRPTRDPVAGILLAAALPLLIAGLVMPALSVTSFVVFGTTYSILDGVLSFWSDGRYALFVLVFLFSVVLPLGKVAIGIWAWLAAAPGETLPGRLLRAAAWVSRWSMLDVCIVALLVVALEGSLLTTADIHAGLVLFAVGVAVSTVATYRLVQR